MRKINSFSLLLIVMLLVLSACSGTSATTEAGTGSEATDSTGAISGTPAVGRTPGAGIEMNEVSQLIFGTLLLGETENTVTIEQAQAMLPLWQLYQTMASEDTTAAEELDAIVQQISRLFAEEQLSAMAEMDFNSSMEMMAELGLTTVPFTTEDGETFDRSEAFQDRPSGDFPEGFEGGGGFGMGAGAGMEFGTGEGVDPEAIATAQAERGSGFGNMQSLMFVPMVIEYLEGLIAG